jgi:hypothetical protein
MQTPASAICGVELAGNFSACTDYCHHPALEPRRCPKWMRPRGPARAVRNPGAQLALILNGAKNAAKEEIPCRKLENSPPLSSRRLPPLP